jgi:tetratricopeptide (TPR) repeat protein
MKLVEWLIRSFRKGNKESSSNDRLDSLIRESHGYLLSQEFDNARNLLLRAIKQRDEIKRPELVDYILTSLEATWLFTDKHEEAIEFFSEYLMQYPDDAAAHRGHGAALWYLGDLSAAFKDYSRALELKPNDAISLSGRGQILAELGSPEKALEDLDQALLTLNAMPISDGARSVWASQAEAFIRNGRGAAFAALRRDKAALEEFKASLILCPNNAWVYDNRGQAYERFGNYERARIDYEVALTKSEPLLSRARKSRLQERMRQLPQ